MLTLRLPKELEDRLDRLAKETGRTKTFYIKQAIEGKIDEIEDIYLSEKVIEDIRAGKEKIYSISEVKKDCGLED